MHDALIVSIALGFPVSVVGVCVRQFTLKTASFEFCFDLLDRKIVMLMPRGG